MSVVIANQEAMCADEFMMTDSKRRSAMKIATLFNGSLIGISGVIDHFEKGKEWAEKWIRGEAFEPIFHGDNHSEFLLLTKDGLFSSCTEYKQWLKCSQQVESIGSGSAFALGAYHAGASLIQAVNIAIDQNVYCGGKPQILTLKED